MKTLYIPNGIPDSVASYYYETLRTSIKWETPSQHGIHSRHGNTRKAYKVTNDSTILPLLQEIFSAISPTVMTTICKETNYNYMDRGECYLNYYENGEMFTPSHDHPGQVQLIISLGATRTLEIDENTQSMGNTQMQCKFVASRGKNRNIPCPKGVWKRNLCPSHFFSDLKKNSQKYSLNNGDLILFGENFHNVPREPEINDGRISIALFLRLY